MMFLTLALLAPLAASAGLPSEDSEVARLQAEFKTAHTPSVAELALGQHWKCDAVNAIKGHMERYSGSDYRFAEKKTANGELYYLELYSFALVQNHQVDAAGISFVYRFNEGLFMGQPYDDPSVARVHTYLRTTADNRLLVEIDTFLYADLPQPMLNKRMEMSVPGSIFPELRLMGFEECRIASD